MVPSTSKSTITINEIRHYTGGTGICPRRPVENCLTHKHMKTEDDKIKGIRICREEVNLEPVRVSIFRDFDPDDYIDECIEEDEAPTQNGYEEWAVAQFEQYDIMTPSADITRINI